MFLAGIQDEQVSGYPTKAFGYDKNRYVQISNGTILNKREKCPENPYK